LEHTIFGLLPDNFAHLKGKVQKRQKGNRNFTLFVSMMRFIFFILLVLSVLAAITSGKFLGIVSRKSFLTRLTEWKLFKIF
jgi:hypothetical protein